jgi:hypothetical protein
MVANDLRIGNRVLALTGETKYTEVTVNTIFGYGINSYYNEAEYLYDEIKPIQLTEEWLLKNKFFLRKFDYSIPISDCEVVWLTLIPQDEECTAYSVCVTQTDEDELDQNVFLSDISYVHQLQNLYYALTNKELTIQ